MRRENQRCRCGHVYGDHFPTPKCEHALGCDCEAFEPMTEARRKLTYAVLERLAGAESGEADV